MSEQEQTEAEMMKEMEAKIERAGTTAELMLQGMANCLDMACNIKGQYTGESLGARTLRDALELMFLNDLRVSVAWGECTFTRPGAFVAPSIKITETVTGEVVGLQTSGCISV
jgi:hypothetical protein